IPQDIRTQYDVHEVIARLVDGSRFHEFKALYGTTLVCGFARIEGFRVGIVANNGVLFSESALKAAHFIELCNQRRVPLVFLQNISGFMVGQEYETGGIAKHRATPATPAPPTPPPPPPAPTPPPPPPPPPRMSGRAYSPRQLWMWPNARISVTGGEQAAAARVAVRMKTGEPTKRVRSDETQPRALSRCYAFKGTRSVMTRSAVASEGTDSGPRARIVS